MTEKNTTMVVAWVAKANARYQRHVELVNGRGVGAWDRLLLLCCTRAFTVFGTSCAAQRSFGGCAKINRQTRTKVTNIEKSLSSDRFN